MFPSIFDTLEEVLDGPLPEPVAIDWVNDPAAVALAELLSVESEENNGRI